MKHYPNSLAVAPMLSLIMLASCGRSAPPTDRTVTRGLDAAERSVTKTDSPASSQAIPPPRPVAVIDGRSITIDQLRPALIEAAGATVLEETLLDELLAREAAARSIAITSANIDAERARLLETFAGAGIARSDDEAARLLQSIRAARGLGEKRFSALLRRNATLRALVAPEVLVTEAGIDHARELRFGERRRARLIVTPTANAATNALARLNSGEDFTALAAEVSTDRSAERGGILEPISTADPEYPAAIRAALRNLKPGETSQPVAIDQGYALLRLDEIIPPSPSAADPDTIRPLLERDVRTQQERILMNQLARRLLDAASITIMDRALDEAWKQRKTR
ncbi:MAG: peptidylprolyl isomerase [Phycisphaerae bacterium]|nr:peptidylprolyl isomerase [Phycisphaerae bacterium]